MIEKKRAGNAIALAEKLGLSERAIYKYLKFMREELKAPVKFSSARQTYIYEQEGELIFGWREIKQD